MTENFKLSENRKPKIILALRKVLFSSYFEFLIKEFVKSGYEVHLFAPDPKDIVLTDFLAEYIDDQSVVVHTLRLGRFKLLRRFIWEIRELRSYRNYLLDQTQSKFYLARWHSYLSWPFRKIFSYQWTQNLLKSETADLILGLIETVVPTDPEVLRVTKELRPQAIIASPCNMKHSYEIEFVKAAKALRVFSIVPVISWDNLTTKGAFAIKPDLLLVWNEKQQQFAKSKHDFSDQEVKIVGACLFDKWWSPGIRAIEAKMNMTKPYVLYLGSSSNIAKDETAVILELQKLLPQFTVCLRPHPENQQVYSSLVGHEEVFVFTDKNSFPSSVKGQSEFGAMIKGAQAIVGINTSAMIDAVVFNKPTVAIVLPQFEKTQKLALHFSDLVDSKAVYVTHSVLECAEKIKTFPGQDDLRPFRESFVKTFVRPKGLNQFAGQVAYQEISYYLHEK